MMMIIEDTDDYNYNYANENNNTDIENDSKYYNNYNVVEGSNFLN